jgi:NAD(P)H-hydrate epimerase
MFLSRQQVREVDRLAIEEFGVPGVVLMENAGRGAAEVLRAQGLHGPVVLCCGKGNNGGDGFVIARHLDNWKVPIRVLLFARPEDLTGDALVNYHIIRQAGLALTVHTEQPVDMEAVERELSGAEWIVDALFGTGLSGALRSPFEEIVKAINAGSARVLAVDIPSGLDCDTGKPLGTAVRAHHTVTFGALKKGFADPAAAQWLGQVHVVDIGAPRRVMESVLAQSS